MIFWKKIKGSKVLPIVYDRKSKKRPDLAWKLIVKSSIESKIVPSYLDANNIVRYTRKSTASIDGENEIVTGNVNTSNDDTIDGNNADSAGCFDRAISCTVSDAKIEE